MDLIIRTWQFWVAISGIVGVVVGFYIKYVQPVRKGLVAMLRSQIVQQYNHYIDLGFCPIYAKENVESLYKQYHALGGNGTMTRLYKELLELPTELD